MNALWKFFISTFCIIIVCLFVFSQCSPNNKPASTNKIYNIGDDTINFNFSRQWLEVQKNESDKWTIFACIQSNWVPGLKLYTQEYEKGKYRFFLNLHDGRNGDPYIVEQVEQKNDSIIIKTDSPIFKLFKSKQKSVWVLTSTGAHENQSNQLIGYYIESKDSTGFNKVTKPCMECSPECD